MSADEGSPGFPPKSSRAHRAPFFVYGTLLTGEGNANRFPENLVTRQPALAHGLSVYSGVWGVPYLCWDADGLAHGELVTIKPDLPQTVYNLILADIDRLEGFRENAPNEGGYRRCAITVVELLDEERLQPVTAWTYIVEDADIELGEKVVELWESGRAQAEWE